MRELIINTVNEFHMAVRSKWDGHAVYRGEPGVSYELRPKMGRFQVKNAKNNIKTEKGALEEFKKRSVPFLKEFPSSSWEWLALAQHHGMPTRLLDWTLNPLVAAYFAVRDNHTINTDCAIYVIQLFQIPHADEAMDPFKIKQDVIYLPRHSSTRFAAQQGLFTVHHDPKLKFDHESLEKWTLKNECLIELEGTLDVYGISHATVFPDLDGLSKHIQRHWIWL